MQRAAGPEAIERLRSSPTDVPGPGTLGAASRVASVELFRVLLGPHLRDSINTPLSKCRREPDITLPLREVRRMVPINVRLLES